jgi:hypothetical protein
MEECHSSIALSTCPNAGWIEFGLQLENLSPWHTISLQIRLCVRQAKYSDREVVSVPQKFKAYLQI